MSDEIKTAMTAVELLAVLNDALAGPKAPDEDLILVFSPQAGKPRIDVYKTIDEVKAALLRALRHRGDGWYSMFSGRVWSIVVDYKRGLAVFQSPTGQKHHVIPDLPDMGPLSTVAGTMDAADEHVPVYDEDEEDEALERDSAAVAGKRDVA